MSEAKEYLLSIALLDAKIDARVSEMDDLKDKLLKITPTLSPDKGGGAGGTQDKMAGTMARIVDMQRQINADIDALIDRKAAAQKMLDSMKNPVHMTVLHRRYFLHQSFERIASDMNYSWRWVCKLHGRALQDFTKVMREYGE
jgi:hypothetical protein